MLRSITRVALSLTVMAACESDDPETTATSTNATTGSGGSALTRWCEAVAAPYCEAVFACCSDATALENWGGTVDACTSQVLADCETGEFAMALPPSDTLTLDEQILGRCLEILEALRSEAPACTRVPPAVVLSSCLYALEGSAAIGETCSGTGYMLQCSDGGCLYDPSLGEGTCATFAPLGTACTMQPCDFRNEVACLDDGTGTYTCQPLRDAGQACLKGFECFSGSCVNESCAAPTPAQLCADS